jgi:DNA-binding PadR family transcriptional regulator
MIIELPILGFLKERPMHGYELMQRLHTVLGFAWQPSYGSLYPMLRKLETRGLITQAGMRRGHGPPKQVYSLTGKGVSRFHELLSKQTPVGLPVQVAFLDHLTSDERRDVLLRIREQKLKTLKRLEERAEKAGSLSKYQEMVMKYGLKTFRQEIDWLERLAQDEE